MGQEQALLVFFIFRMAHAQGFPSWGFITRGKNLRTLNSALVAMTP